MEVKLLDLLGACTSRGYKADLVLCYILMQSSLRAVSIVHVSSFGETLSEITCES